MPVQSSAGTGSIKIDWTQLMQVEMPIFFLGGGGGRDKNEINGKAADLRCDFGLQAVVYLSLLVLGRISPPWCASPYTVVVFMRSVCRYKCTVINTIIISSS